MNARLEKVLTQPFSSIVEIPEFIEDEHLRTLLGKYPIQDYRVIHHLMLKSDYETFEKLVSILREAGWLRKRKVRSKQ